MKFVIVNWDTKSVRVIRDRRQAEDASRLASNTVLGLFAERVEALPEPRRYPVEIPVDSDEIARDLANPRKLNWD